MVCRVSDNAAGQKDLRCCFKSALDNLETAQEEAEEQIFEVESTLTAEKGTDSEHPGDTEELQLFSTDAGQYFDDIKSARVLVASLDHFIQSPASTNTARQLLEETLRRRSRH
jgi:hypothetical protein